MKKHLILMIALLVTIVTSTTAQNTYVYSTYEDGVVADSDIHVLEDMVYDIVDGKWDDIHEVYFIEPYTIVTVVYFNCYLFISKNGKRYALSLIKVQSDLVYVFTGDIYQQNNTILN